MWYFLKNLFTILPLAALVLITGVTAPAWATVAPGMPVWGAGGIAGAAIIAALIIAKLWRRN